MNRLTDIVFFLMTLLLSACAHHQTNLGLAAPMAGIGARASTSAEDWANSNHDARHIKPGDTLVLADLQGPGIIRHLWNTVASDERGYSRLLVLRMYWDGETEPSVETPLGDFFAMGHGRDLPVESLPVMVSSEGRARNCYWPMPFHRSARITVTNEGEKPVYAFYSYVDWEQVPYLPRNTRYFHAQYRQEYPTRSGERYWLADIEGSGHYVGTVLSVRQRTSGWWGEGDDFFYVDGEEEPSLRGTGSEDYLSQAWGLRDGVMGPYYGSPLFEGLEAFAQCTNYRWHVADPIPFKKSLRVEIEHVGVVMNSQDELVEPYGERSDDFSSVAFWYQREPHKLFAPIPNGYLRLYNRPEDIVGMEGEHVIEVTRATSGELRIQDIGNASGDQQTLWIVHKPKQKMYVQLNTKEAFYGQLVLRLAHSFDYGLFNIYFDGALLLRNIDLYNEHVSFEEHKLGLIDIKPGPHELVFENTGRNSASTGYLLGFDRFEIIPLRNITGE